MKYLIVVFCLGFASCITIKINNSNHGQLTVQQKQHVLKFSDVVPTLVCNYADSCVLTEIDSKGIFKVAQKSDYLWVHTFSPWCSSDGCINQARYIAEAAKYRGKLKIMMFSNSYDFKNIAELMSPTSYRGMVYVGDFNFYGSNIKKVQKSLANELFHKKSKYYSDYIIAKDTVVLFKGWEESYDQFFDKIAATVKR